MKQKKSEKKMSKNGLTCPMCVRSQIHGRRHGKNYDADRVLCLPHRILSWLSSNAYHEGNVRRRNPYSAEKYNIMAETREIDEYPDPENFPSYHALEKACEGKILTHGGGKGQAFSHPPRFAFSVIAQTPPIVIKYNPAPYDRNIIDVVIYPSVIADVIGGEYRNRRLAIIFGILQEGEKWIYLEEDETVRHFFHYVGFSRLEACIDTCVHGGAEPNTIDDFKAFRQRKECENCPPRSEKAAVTGIGW
ncbi:MAG: hypothetical protein R6V04_14160 [bacterium]